MNPYAVALTLAGVCFVPVTVIAGVVVGSAPLAGMAALTAIVLVVGGAALPRGGGA